MPALRADCFRCDNLKDVTIMTTLSEMILDATSLDNRRDLINSIKALIGVILALVIAVVLTVFLFHEVSSAISPSKSKPASVVNYHSRSQ